MTKQRPEIKNIINEHTSDKEMFQNKVIRPIIKMQNDLIMSCFRKYVQSRKLSFESRTAEHQRKVVESVMNKDIQLKNFFIGMVVGHFNLSELEDYFLHPSEYNRRIKQIITQRILDQTKMR